MKIGAQYKVREMAGEHVIVLPGRYGADMTRLIALNNSSLLLWEELSGRDFEAADAEQLLLDHYGIDAETAHRDVAVWIDQLRQHGLLEE